MSNALTATSALLDVLTLAQTISAMLQGAQMAGRDVTDAELDQLRTQRLASLDELRESIARRQTGSAT